MANAPLRLNERYAVSAEFTFVFYEDVEARLCRCRIVLRPPRECPDINSNPSAGTGTTGKTRRSREKLASDHASGPSGCGRVRELRSSPLKARKVRASGSSLQKSDRAEPEVAGSSSELGARGIQAVAFRCGCRSPRGGAGG